MELLAHQIRVPEQVRVTGVDDSPICEGSPVPITSVTAEATAIGLATVTAVLERLEGREVPSQLISPKLIQRESTGKPPS